VSDHLEADNPQALARSTPGVAGSRPSAQCEIRSGKEVGMVAEYQSIRLEVDRRGVATITLARPDVHNAFGEQMIADLAAAADRIASEPAIRVVVLTGEGKSFSAGGDLRWFERAATGTREFRIEGSRALASMLRAIDELPRPVVGRVNGQAYGGGVGLISVCDLSVGADHARFGLTEVRLGLLPANISPFVVRRIGARNCRRTMLSGRIFGADEAADLGLLDRVVPAAALDDAVEGEVQALLAAAPGAAGNTKRLIRYVASHAMDECLAYSAESLADAWETDEGREGIASFLGKREPAWRGN
jgi:methylglutaconyl-CoA hydratase